MQLSTREISELVGGTLKGNETLVVSGASGLSEATSTDVSFLKDSKDAKAVASFHTSQAGVILVPIGFVGNGKTVVEVPHPLAAFSKILSVIAQDQQLTQPGVSKVAHISPDAKIGADVTIGPFAVIESGATIEANVVISAHVYVGARSRIGKNSHLYPQVVVREDVQIGERCIIHAGAVIGSDGYGFYFAQGRHNKIPQVGTVVIEDDVEVGSCTTIDRATTGKTLIKRGTKIDNLVQVAHNVEVGEHSLLVAQVGIGGSCRLGAGVVMAGQSGVADHITIGAAAKIGGQAGVTREVAAGEVLWGTPAIPLLEKLREVALMKKIPQLVKQIRSKINL